MLRPHFAILGRFAAAFLCLAWAHDLAVADDAPAREPNRPVVPGTLKLHVRERQETRKGSGKYKTIEREVEWQASETAIIICDMWNNHYCQSAAQRVGVMAPKMNAVITAARNRGVTIIHAPSGVLDFYHDTAYRRRMLQAAPAEPPVPIEASCGLDPTREPPLPVDVSQPSDDPRPAAAVQVFHRQHPGIDIAGYDGISDSGQEIYNFCRQEGIENIAIMGVHTNMCVLGRSFGIRQMVRLNMHVVLVRDLTDAMYDPRCPPYVSHTRGTELVVEHIEKYWCPSVASDDLTTVIEGSDDPVVEPAARERPASPDKPGQPAAKGK